MSRESGLLRYAIAQDPDLRFEIQVRKNIDKKPHGQLCDVPCVGCSYSPKPEIALLIALRRIQQLGIILPVYAVKGIVQNFPEGLVAFRVLFPPGCGELDIGADNVKLACIGKHKMLEMMPEKKLGEFEHPALFPVSIRPTELRAERKDKRQVIEQLLMNQNSPATPLPQKEGRHRYSIFLVLQAAEENRLAEIGKLYKAHSSIVPEIRYDSLAQYGLQCLKYSVYRLIRRNRNTIWNLVVQLNREHRQPSLYPRNSNSRKVIIKQYRHTDSFYPVVART